MEIIDVIFSAVVVTLFVANWSLAEIRSAKTLFGTATLQKPKSGASIIEYINNDENVDALKRYFYFRNILKILFGMFCVSSVIYGILITISMIKFDPVELAIPTGVTPQPVTVEIQSEGASFHGDKYQLKNSLVISKIEQTDIAVYSVDLDKKAGRLYWLSGNGLLTRITLATSAQIFGVLSVFCGIASFAYASVLRQNP